MFKNKKTKHLHLTYFPSIIVVVSALDSQYRSPGFKSLGWLQSQLSLLLLWGWLNEYQELLGTDW